MSDSHPLRVLLGQLETALDSAVEAAGGDGGRPASGMSALRNDELEDLATRAWRLMQRVQGLVLVPVVAEADERRLFKTREYESASSSRDLVRSWLRCDPPVANKLVQVGKEAVTGRYTATAEALASGEIDVDHAARVVRAVKRLPTSMVDPTQRLEAQDTMLRVAKTTDPEVTHAAGYHLLELVAPDEAANYFDTKAERERLAAEEARWLEVTSTPIAGCKELRLRLEASTMNTLIRLVESLTQPVITDTNQNQSEDHDQDREQDWEQVQGEDRGGLPEPGWPGAPDRDQEPVDVPAGSGAPGNPTGPLAPLIPLERRRADAMAELITSMAQPHPADELDPAQLHRLADELAAAQDARIALDARAEDDVQGAQAAPDAGVPNVPGVRARQDLSDGRGVLDPRAGGRHRAGQSANDREEQNDERWWDYERDREDVLEHEREGVADSQGERGDKQGGEPALAAVASSSGRNRGRNRDRVHGERPSLVVITTYDPVRQRFRTGEASSPGAPTTRLSPVEVEMAACEGLVTPVWMTQGQTPTSVASPSRYFRGKQLSALIARDRGCCFPNCSRGVRYVHGHHIIPVSQGGETKVDNGALLCSHHHTVIHAPGGWTMRLGDDGLPEFIPPYWIDRTRTPQRHVRHQLRLPVAA